ncbi:MAG: deoxyribodipyrimidine photo-lyase [Chloroflexota bacterium]|nr:deoxyribodipyrimidine photo-lyase [Chloroflexota bacterium]
MTCRPVSRYATSNHALEYAVREANHRGLPVVAVFGVTQRVPDANTRSYAFVLEGLRETEQALRERGIRLVIKLHPPVGAVRDLAGDAALAARVRKGASRQTGI